jgi:PAT family acetyl-CoA transporter-like MFS transporter 1
LIHLVAKIGFQVNDSVTGLKLLEKGLSKEDLAVAVLIDFPFQMAGGWLAARWARKTGGGGPLRPWLGAFWARLGMAVIATLVVASFPKGAGGVGNVYFGAVIATTLLASFTR